MNILSLLAPEYRDVAVQIGTGEVIIPETVDGATKYAYVRTGYKSAKPRKTTKDGVVTETPAFDLDEAVAAYEAQKAKAAERAAKPKAAKEPKADSPEDVALMDEIASLLSAENALTAQEIAPMLAEETTWQKVSAMLKRMTNRGQINKVDKDGKAGYVLA